MAQLRQDYAAFKDRGAEIVVVGPEDLDAFRRRWAEDAWPFIGLADPEHLVSTAYGQQVSWTKLGRMPALVLIDRTGVIRYQHHGNTMRDIASSDSVLRALDELNRDVSTSATAPGSDRSSRSAV